MLLSGCRNTARISLLCDQAPSTNRSPEAQKGETRSHHSQDVLPSKRGHVSGCIQRPFYDQLSSPCSQRAPDAPQQGQRISPSPPSPAPTRHEPTDGNHQQKKSHSNQRLLQTVLVLHAATVTTSARGVWLRARRAPVLVLNPLSKHLLRPHWAGCCYSGRAAFWEGL